jgi:putative glycosyltransferase (TIGR04348 family)
VKVRIITPAPPRSRSGNRRTALRWAGILRGLGHRTIVETVYRGGGCDLLIALHAVRSHGSIARFARQCPLTPIVVGLTGTDLYGGLHSSPRALRSLGLASRLVVLQPLGIDDLPAPFRRKARVIHQSAESPRTIPPERRGVFEVCVIGHLRPVKDPFRTAMAARLLPASSRIQVLHLGAALSGSMARRARAETERNRRYRWRGDLDRWSALRILARSRLLVLTSRMEGGANVLSEALAASTPIIASHIPGSIGILGTDYPGTFPVGHTRALAALLWRAESNPSFYRSLQRRCRRLRRLVDPTLERRMWRRLLGELSEAR